MWLVSRASATSHYAVAIGNIFVPARSTHVDYNEANTEVGLPGIWQNTSAWTASSIIGPTLINNAPFIWYQTAPATKSTLQGTAGPAVRALNYTNTFAAYSTLYSPVAGGSAAMLPLNWYLEVSTAANAGNGSFVIRGVYLSANMQTRTTIQSGSPASTIGYTFFPDDVANGSATNSASLAFMNTP
jgi:hypothetical protein